MKIKELDKWFREYFSIDDVEDSACNGLQVGRYDVDVRKIAFAVDAGLEVFKKVANENAQLLFVHHGLFWANTPPIIESMYERINYLIEQKLSLYAVHLPLDRHHETGHNMIMAKKLELKHIEPFGLYNGIKIGCKGHFSRPVDIDYVIDRLNLNRSSIRVLTFKQEPISKVAIVSGGAAKEVYEAIDEDIDLYITGEADHSVYHACQEAGITVLFAGHYATETFGIKALCEKVRTTLNIETLFIDCPTGL